MYKAWSNLVNEQGKEYLELGNFLGDYFKKTQTRFGKQIEDHNKRRFDSLTRVPYLSKMRDEESPNFRRRPHTSNLFRTSQQSE